MKWVTTATSGCFVFPKQWEGHKCHFYLCSYQHWTGGHGLPFLVPATTASLRNLGPPLTIVLSYRKYGSLLTPSIHWVSCVRLPRPVFIFFAFCLYPPYRIFLTSTKPYKREDGTISTIGRRCSTVTNASLSLRGYTSPTMKGSALSYCDLSLGVALNSQVSIRSAEKSFSPPKPKRTSINFKLSSPFNGHCLWQISLLHLEKRLKERL